MMFMMYEPPRQHNVQVRCVTVTSCVSGCRFKSANCYLLAAALLQPPTSWSQ